MQVITYSAIVEDTAKKPTEPDTNVIPDETGYEAVTPSPTTPTSSPEDYIDISQATTILESDVDLTCDIVEDFIQEKMQRTKMKNKQRKKKIQPHGHVTTSRSSATRSRGGPMGHRWKCHLKNEV